MKYAIISLVGALGMGLSAIADGMNGHSEGEVYAIIGCSVMILGLVGAMATETIQWWNNRKNK